MDKDNFVAIAKGLIGGEWKTIIDDNICLRFKLFFQLKKGDVRRDGHLFFIYLDTYRLRGFFVHEDQINE